jgi:hypothetical protein
MPADIKQGEWTLSQRQKLRHKRSIPGGFTQEEWERAHNF